MNSSSTIDQRWLVDCSRPAVGAVPVQVFIKTVRLCMSHDTAV